MKLESGRRATIELSASRTTLLNLQKLRIVRFTQRAEGAFAFVRCPKVSSGSTGYPVSNDRLTCGRLEALWPRFVYAQAIGWPDSRSVRHSCEESGPRRTTQYFLPTQSRPPGACSTAQALSSQPSRLAGEAGRLAIASGQAAQFSVITTSSSNRKARSAALRARCSSHDGRVSISSALSRIA